jgi:photosystem II stability/assembly factor-like uncharacterized protein
MKKTQSFLFGCLLAFAVSPSVFAAQWQHGNNLYGERVNALAVSGTSLFAGTRDSGVFRSNDSGTSWVRVNSGLTDLYIRALAIKGTLLFTGTQDSGMFRSSDNGAHWSAINTGMSSTNIQALAVNDSFLFAGTDGGGVCRSSDNGAHWLAVNKLDDGTDLHFKSIYSFGISSGYVFIGTWGGSAFRSRDNGMTWYLITNGLWDPRMNIIPYSWAVGDTFIFAGTSGRGVVRAKDSAGVWFPAATGLPDSAIVTALALYQDTLFAATQKGIFVSSDNGDSWAADNTGLSDTVVLAFTVSGNQLFAGTNGGGVWRRPLSGMSIPAAPVISILNAIDTCVADTASCVWQKAGPYVSKYQVQAFSDSQLATLTKSDSTITGTVFMLRSLSNNTTCWWHVRACNGAGWGPYSTVSQITVRIATTAVPGSRVMSAAYGAFINNGYIHYSLPRQCLVSLIAYDARGRLIWNYVSSQQQPGSYHVALDSTPLAAGPYFLRFIAGSFNRVFMFDVN